MSSNTDFVAALYDAFGRGDVQSIVENCDPAVSWNSNCNAATIPWSGARSGAGGVVSFFQALGDNLDFEAFEPRQFLDADEAVTVLGRTRAACKTGGQGSFDSEWVHVFMIDGGKLTRFDEFYDTAAIERALAV